MPYKVIHQPGGWTKIHSTSHNQYAPDREHHEHFETLAEAKLAALNLAVEHVSECGVCLSGDRVERRVDCHCDRCRS